VGKSVVLSGIRGNSPAGCRAKIPDQLLHLEFTGKWELRQMVRDTSAQRKRRTKKVGA